MKTKTIAYIRNLLLENKKNLGLEAQRAQDVFMDLSSEDMDKKTEARKIYFEKFDNFCEADKAFEDFEAQQW